jgi:hypothetical protein
MKRVVKEIKTVTFSLNELLGLIHKELDEEGYIIHFEFDKVNPYKIEKITCTKTTEIK